MPLADASLIRDPARLTALRRTRLLDAPPEAAFDRLTRLAGRMIGAPVALISLVDGHRQFFPGIHGLRGWAADARETPLSHSFCQHVVADDRPLVVEDARVHPLVHDNRAVADLGVLAYAGTPVRDREGVPLGALCVIDSVPRGWTGDELAVLSDLAEAVMTEVELRRALREEVRRSRTDPLTDLLNRRAMREAMEAEFARAARHGTRTGVLLIDVDHFKRINDTHGHAAGDAVLRHVAATIHGAVRAYDVVARWGGEEFAVLLPAIPDEDALALVAESVRGTVAAAVARHGSTAVTVRISIGCALAPAGTGEVDALVDAADRALYAAKRRGRDRCVLASELRGGDDGPSHPPAVGIAIALSRAAGLREGVSGLHCHEVADLAVRLASAAGLDAATQLRCRLAGWLHDVGKVALPESILTKPGPLTEAERQVVMAHPALGEQIIADVPDLRDVAPAVRHHHERFDGRGYPDGLAGEDIPVEARIVCLADAWSAMTSDRVYRRGLSRADALRETVRCGGTQFDPALVDALLRVLAEQEDPAGGPAVATGGGG